MNKNEKNPGVISKSSEIMFTNHEQITWFELVRPNQNGLKIR